ncbi:MAG: hypothetical protein ACXVFL_17805 [Solirubrobacteraceae bacterium]
MGGPAVMPARARADTRSVRPLSSLFALRGDGSVDTVLHEIRVAGWHAVSRSHGDRVLIGPGGLIAVAERGGAARLRDEWADEARALAAATARMTGRDVDALVVLTRHVEWRDPRPFRGATVLPVAVLADFLTGRPRKLSPADIDALRGRMQRALAV